MTKRTGFMMVISITLLVGAVIFWLPTQSLALPFRQLGGNLWQRDPAIATAVPIVGPAVVEDTGQLPSMLGVAANGDYGLAIRAILSYPQALALDGVGNLYIAELGGTQIRQVATNGIIQTVAFQLLTPDLQRALHSYQGGAQMPDGQSLLLADTVRNQVSIQTADGQVSILAGNGQAGFSGDGGAAAAAQLNQPVALLVDSVGNVYIADKENHRVRRVNPAGIIETIAGGGGQ